MLVIILFKKGAKDIRSQDQVNICELNLKSMQT